MWVKQLFRLASTLTDKIDLMVEKKPFRFNFDLLKASRCRSHFFGISFPINCRINQTKWGILPSVFESTKLRIWNDQTTHWTVFMLQKHHWTKAFTCSVKVFIFKRKIKVQEEKEDNFRVHFVFVFC